MASESERKTFATLPMKRRFEEEAGLEEESNKSEQMERSPDVWKIYHDGTSQKQMKNVDGKENLYPKRYRKTPKITHPLRDTQISSSARGNKKLRSSSTVSVLPERDTTEEVPPTRKLQKTRSQTSGGISKLGHNLNNMQLRSQTSQPQTGNKLTASDSQYKEHFDQVARLGSGGFGDVYKARYKLTGKEYAVKRVLLENSESSKRKGLREVTALEEINHPHIVRYNTAWIEEHTAQEEMDASSRSKDSNNCEVQQSSAGMDIVFESQAGEHCSDLKSHEEMECSSESSTEGTDCMSESSTDVTDTVSESIEGDSRNNTLCSGSVYLYIQMELCHDKTLADWLLDHPDSGREEKLRYFKQIVDAVHHIHSLNFIHRDLKPSNIFFSLDQESLKIGDLGLVTVEEHSSSGGDAEKKAAPHTCDVGTELYQSPEQQSGKKYTQKIDIYALGVIFLEMMSSFGTQAERIMELWKLKTSKKEALSHFYQNYPMGKSLVAEMLADDPHARPTAQEILQHPLLKEPKAVTEASSLEY